MTCDTGDRPRRRFHSSIGGLMITVAVCALLLVPVGWRARERAVRRAWLVRAHAARLRAIALEQRFREQHLARIRAQQRASAVIPAEGMSVTAESEWPSP
jgi:hypothetical protein